MTLPWPTEMGTWTWNGQSLIWPGAQPQNLEQLWSGAQTQSDNLDMPEVDGRLPRDVLVVEQEITIRYLLSALRMPNGDPAPNPAAGIAANYAQLTTRVGGPSTWPTRKGVQTSVLRSDGVTLTGLAQGYVSRLGDREGSACRCAVVVTIPGGALQPEES